MHVHLIFSLIPPIPWSLWLRDVRVLPVDIVEVTSEYQEGQHQQKHQGTKTEVHVAIENWSTNS